MPTYGDTYCTFCDFPLIDPDNPSFPDPCIDSGDRLAQYSWLQQCVVLTSDNVDTPIKTVGGLLNKWVTQADYDAYELEGTIAETLGMRRYAPGKVLRVHQDSKTHVPLHARCLARLREDPVLGGRVFECLTRDEPVDADAVRALMQAHPCLSVDYQDQFFRMDDMFENGDGKYIEDDAEYEARAECMLELIKAGNGLRDLEA